MDDFIIPDWAKRKLVGLTIESIGETFPHALSFRFTDGSSLDVVGMPFADGTLDASFVESTSSLLSNRP